MYSQYSSGLKYSSSSNAGGSNNSRSTTPTYNNMYQGSGYTSNIVRSKFANYEEDEREASPSTFKQKPIQKLPWDNNLTNSNDSSTSSTSSNKLNSYRLSNSINASVTSNTSIRNKAISNSGINSQVFESGDEDYLQPKVNRRSNSILSNNYDNTNNIGGLKPSRREPNEEEGSTKRVESSKPPFDSKRLRKQSAPPSSKSSLHSGSNSANSSRSSSRQSPRTESDMEDSYDIEEGNVDVRESVQRYDSAIKAVVGGGAASPKPKLNANRTKQPISTNSKERSQPPKIPNQTVGIENTKPILGQKKNQGAWITAYNTPLDLFNKELYMENIVEQPVKEIPINPKITFIKRKSLSSTTFVKSKSTYATLPPKQTTKAMPTTSHSVGSNIKQNTVSHKKVIPPEPVRNITNKRFEKYEEEEPEEEEEEEEDEEDEEDEDEEEEEEEEVKPPPRRTVKNPIDSKKPTRMEETAYRKVIEKDTSQTKKLSNANKSTKQGISTQRKEEVNFDDKPIIKDENTPILAKNDAFEALLRKELQAHANDEVENNGMRKCPFCKGEFHFNNDQDFRNHKTECKKRNTTKAEPKKIEILDKDLLEEKKKLPKSDYKAPKKGKWRLEHMQFQNVLNPSGGEVFVVEDQRTCCEYCGRKFDQLVYERHVKSCKEKATRTAIKNPKSQPIPSTSSSKVSNSSRNSRQPSAGTQQKSNVSTNLSSRQTSTRRY